MAYNNALSSYKETRIKTAGQGQLIIMLYDEALKQLDRALGLITLNGQGKKEPGRIELIGRAIMKTEEIITELTVSLDFEKGGEISKNLFSLYSWFNKELLEVNITQDAERLIKVKEMINDLRNAWYEIAVKSKVGKEEHREILGVNIAG